MKKKLCLIMLPLLMLMLTVNSQSKRDSLSTFCSGFINWTKTQDIHAWGAKEQDVFLELAVKHHLISGRNDLSEYQWNSPGLAFYAVFEAAYGPDRYWSLEQSHQYSMAAYESGLEDSIKYLLPPEDGMSQDEAVQLGTVKLSSQLWTPVVMSCCLGVEWYERFLAQV